jgi:voltage-gated potassium channel
VLVVLLLPLSEATIQLLSIYDNLICVIFLIDFFLNLHGASKKSDYFIKECGWLDLLDSIPS